MSKININYPAHFNKIDFSSPLKIPSISENIYSKMTPPQRGVVLELQTLAFEKPKPMFSREDLEVLSSGVISTQFGDWFKPLDQYHRVIRMPEPPLLLADRVIKITGEPGKLGKGTIWTETDVTDHAWYLHQGRMPAGIMIESGQADLLLISWLGMDFLNREERIYRLLGCELSYYGGLPKPGDTLCYDIHVDGYANHGDVRLFFFHYDCRINGELRLKVRHGQAGFFTDQELAESKGVLWSPEEETIDSHLPLDAPSVPCQHTTFTKEQLILFSKGNIPVAFGKGFERAHTHTRSPHIGQNQLLMIDEITHFDLKGGPWKRGYMRATQTITPDDWFFKGHFKNDPCMPGTLMLEAGLQVMSVYITALGYSLDKDGWRFEPVTDLSYKLRCRGQVIPSSKEVSYEIFISSIIASPNPTLYADLLGTVDGLKAFHTKIALRLVPDWPMPKLIQEDKEQVVAKVNHFSFNYRSLIACALGRPSEAFGPFYEVFDYGRRVPRLPNPPYHFMSRVTAIQAEQGKMVAGGQIAVEYDVPVDAWYFHDNGFATMPLAVLMEVGLQPCGWLASYLGSALTSEEDFLFRNLDGSLKIYKEVVPNGGSITTQVKCTGVNRSAGMIIESFKVSCFQHQEKIYEMDTIFGFFPLAAFENQVGIPGLENENHFLTLENNIAIDLQNYPPYFSNSVRLPKPSLLMIDRLTGFWRSENNKATLRAEKIVKPDDWFFKAHFFQDPVQPGSLGVEALLQLLQCYLLEEYKDKNLMNMRFEPLALGSVLTWKYRGQVVPENKVITLLMNILETGEDEQGYYAIAEGSLWVDGKRIYEVKKMGMRMVSLERKIAKPREFVTTQRLPLTQS